VDDRMAVEVVDAGHDAIREFLFRGDADVAEHGTRELGEETLDEVEPGAMLGREGEFEAAGGLLCEPGPGLLGDVGRMIVEDQLDPRVGRIRSVEQREEFDEFATTVAVSDQRVNLPADEINQERPTAWLRMQSVSDWSLVRNSRFSRKIGILAILVP
jgi:hypothetical protein